MADNATYQTWRLMANMKELLVEVASCLLVQRYGALEQETCLKLLARFDVSEYFEVGEIREVAQAAAHAKDFQGTELFARIFSLLKFAAGQFWLEKRQMLLSTSRIRTVLLRRDIAAEFKGKVREVGELRFSEKAWKPQGKTFLESLPELPR